MTAEEILNTSTLLIKSDCKIVDDVLYEHCKVDALYSTECYRFFITDDHYDYVEDPVMIARLDKLFK